MARDRVEAFVRTVEAAVQEHRSTQAVIEALRIFGYINELQYSELNTAWTRITSPVHIRSDGAETIELAREHKDPEEILPKEF